MIKKTNIIIDDMNLYCDYISIDDINKISSIQTTLKNILNSNLKNTIEKHTHINLNQLYEYLKKINKNKDVTISMITNKEQGHLNLDVEIPEDSDNSVITSDDILMFANITYDTFYNFLENILEDSLEYYIKNNMEE